jgi:Flp pilus assembly pilin Flp
LVAVVLLAGLRGVGGWLGFKSGLERGTVAGEGWSAVVKWCLLSLVGVVVLLAGLVGVGGWLRFMSGLERVMNYGECLA